MQQAMDDTVNIKSKTEYYDSNKVLSKWGFTDDKCYNCGILNSDLNGLLMQCGKCKKAYYCSKKCFNDHLPEHNKFCGTEKIHCEPTGKGQTTLTFEEEPAFKPETPGPKKKVSKKKGAKKEKMEIAEEFVSEREGKDEVTELQSSLRSLDLPVDPHERQTLYHSFSDFGRGPATHISEQEGFVREEVDLRHAEVMKVEYGWILPEWVDAQLRPTSHGKLMKERGNIASPVTNAKVLIEKGVVAWQAPVWANAKLRKTPRGDEIKRRFSLEGKEALAEEQETTANHLRP